MPPKLSFQDETYNGSMGIICKHQPNRHNCQAHQIPWYFAKSHILTIHSSHLINLL